MSSKHIAYTAVLIFLFGCGSVFASFIDPPVHSGKWTNKYDRHFKKYSKRYFGRDFDWQWFKAQAIAESGLSHDARSRTGAQGLMQIMPATFDEINKKNPHFSKLESPKRNIAAGIYYNHTLYKKFKQTAAQEKLYMTFASYNAGYGRFLKAKKRAASKQNWDQIKPYLPKETQGYVRRIRKLMGEPVQTATR